MKRDHSLYLDDIIEATGKILEYTAGMEFEDFRKDSKTVDAVIRNFEILGEAAKHVPAAIKRKHPGIPRREMARMRDKLIHEYFGIRHDIVWKTVKERLPELRQDITNILESGNGSLLIKP
jgi:uncharacterized protein with HEPN domain